jgi:hypothetical protein
MEAPENATVEYQAELLLWLLGALCGHELEPSGGKAVLIDTVTVAVPSWFLVRRRSELTSGCVDYGLQ